MLFLFICSSNRRSVTSKAADLCFASSWSFFMYQRDWWNSGCSHRPTAAPVNHLVHVSVARIRLSPPCLSTGLSVSRVLSCIQLHDMTARLHHRLNLKDSALSSCRKDWNRGVDVYVVFVLLFYWPLILIQGFAPCSAGPTCGPSVPLLWLFVALTKTNMLII